MERPALIDQLAAFFAAHPAPVVAAWLFGSQARGDARADSDVDVAVLLARSLDSYDSLMLSLDLAAALERYLDHDVDVVVMNDAAPDLAHRVLRDGVLALDRDRATRIAFEVHSRNEYFDMVPVLRRYRGLGGDEP